MQKMETKLLDWFGLKEGRWECYRKYIEQNSFSNFLSMQNTNRGPLTVVACCDCQNIIATMFSSVSPLEVKKIAEADLIYVSTI